MPNKRYQLCIDGYEANVTNRVGSNVYAFEVIKQLSLICKQHLELIVTVLLPNAPVADMPKPTSRWRYQVVTPTSFWTQWGLPLHLWRNRHTYDLLFCPGHYAPRICPIPYISSVMDTAYLEYPQQFKRSDLVKLKWWTQYSVQHAVKVITISEFTKQAVVKAYNRKASDVVVAYPAATLTQPAPKSIVRTLGIKPPYFLYVGTLQPRKNLMTLIESYEHYCQLFTQTKLPTQQHKTIRRAQLVLAGKVGWLTEPILKRIQTSPERDDIFVTGYVDEPAKARLYTDATATILIGLHEGFGIPPLESLGFGTIPIVSDTTSLPEVVGSAGVLVNPRNSKEIAQAMLDTQRLSGKRRAVYSRRGREQFKKFNWGNTAQVIWQTIQEQLVKNR